jgi:hypothetical protein
MQRARLFPLAFLSLSFWVNGCALLGIRSSERYDERSFSILNLNLFNQRTPSTLSRKNWKGDWLFRRERLELIDEQLRISRPDIVVFQELLTRRGSPSESDINILNFGALEGYEWDAEMVTFHKDTQEMQYQAVAVGLPVKLSASDRMTKKYWPIGIDGFMTYTLLELDQQPILLLNVSMPGGAQKVDHWYEFVEAELNGLLKELRICKQRLVISGYLPGGVIWPGFATFAEAFELKDTSAGFCEATSDCLTSSHQNDLFMATAQGQSPSHSERIMVHRDALVSFSNVVMNKMRDRTVYGEDYGLQRLWASRVYGWLANVRLQRCPAS